MRLHHLLELSLKRPSLLLVALQSRFGSSQIALIKDLGSVSNTVQVCVIYK